MPDNIKKGEIYISSEYGVAIHRCPCGCGNEVVTPISPNGWRLIFNGKTITLHPSIGNWHLACKSHYWIIDNKIKPTKDWLVQPMPKSVKKKRKIRLTFKRKS